MRSLLLKATMPLLFFSLQSGITRSQNTSDGLFSRDTVLHLKLTGDVRKLFNDRGEERGYHPLQLSYLDSDNQEVTVSLKAKTRGNFRRNKDNCTYPPILLNFQKNNVTNTIFKEQDKLKLVIPCRGDKYVIREYLVYKLYNLLTPKSFKARLVKTEFSNAGTKYDLATYGILLEEDDQVATRNGMKLLHKQKLQGQQTESETFIKMAVFQYMIGNTDWSVPYLHNIRIIAYDSLSVPYTVPYDFDHAGIVDAPYALPPAELGLRNTHERIFRGYCISDKKAFQQVITTFNRLRQDFYQVYTDCTLLDSKYISATIKYLDQFYETINNPRKLNIEFNYSCKSVGPNIELKGLGKSDN